MEKLFLEVLRHGSTPALEEGDALIQDSIRGKLSPLGRIQAKLARARLSSGYDHLFIAASERAERTARIAIPNFNEQSYSFELDLREREYGTWVGWRSSRIREIYDAHPSSIHLCPEGGESLIDAQNRIARFYKETLLTHAKRLWHDRENLRFLIIGHGTVSTCLFFHILHGRNFLDVNEFFAFRRGGLENCSLSSILITREAHSSVAQEIHWNDTLPQTHMK